MGARESPHEPADSCGKQAGRRARAAPHVMAERRDHLPEIDEVKGLAILMVVCIHAKLYASTLLFDRLVNRAVPIFLVLFGITTELSFAAHAKRDVPLARWWYQTRLRRLVPPYWVMIAAWWGLALWSGHAAFLKLGAREATLMFLGYAPWIGTSWFVTLILELVLVVPGYRWLVGKLGPVPSLALSAAATAAGAYYLWYIAVWGMQIFGHDAPEPGWYYQWIFFPRVLWPVTVGFFVARWWGGRISKRATVIALALTVFGSWLADVARGAPEDAFVGLLRQQVVTCLIDAPLAIGLLGLFQWLPVPRTAARFLSFCGAWSWGIYLAHLLVHELLFMKHFDPEKHPESVRAVYAVFLLTVGIALALLTERVGRLLGVNRRPPPALEPGASQT